MSEYGFQLVRLALTGAGVADAEVVFGSGLNIISGPSDTGKTFILQCIDFMLGAKDTPHEIPEASRYDRALLEIRPAGDTEVLTLTRSLQGGSFQLTRPSGETATLGDRHVAENPDTLSAFLLELTGLQGKLVRKNQRGDTRSLSFRDLAHLAIISEQEVMREGSPVLSGQYISKTVEASVFKLLLTGIDDSSIIASEDRRVSVTRTQAKEEVIAELMGRSRSQFDELHVEGDLQSFREQLERIDSVCRDAEAQMQAMQGSVTTWEGQRRDKWLRLRQIESRLDVLAGLENRFQLLEQQYFSDIRRLEAIAEAGGRLNEMNAERCPVCGALAEHHDLSHQDTTLDPNIVVEGCIAELNRIQNLLNDLEETRADLGREKEDLTVAQRELQAGLVEVSGEINERLKPRLQIAIQRLQGSRESRDKVQLAISALERIEELNAILSEVTAVPVSVSSDLPPQNAPSLQTEDFCAEVESRLRAWSFPDLSRVTFSETDWDIIISGRRRTSHGKGVRAITHAAFTLALLRYCATKSMPHPGIVVIDSPLVVYRAPDPDEAGFSPDVKGAFYRDLSASFLNEQVIILENDEPPQDVGENPAVNVIRFTKTDAGRKGFIP